MLDTTTKKRIDDCRDILVGKLPDPKAQIEQITIGLIYKFMDDMDKEAIELGGTAKFFSGDYEKYSWGSLFDTKVTATEMLRLYSEAIESMEKNPNIPQLFRNIFNNAYLPYRDPETLKLFLKTIGEFEYTHSEMLGDAFEYLLSVMGSQGDAGQFRTPRHIIDFLVAVVNPGKIDTILDPACGTAGFLISAFKHIKEKNNNELNPDERKKLIQNFVGYDISPDMVRLSLVNLYLHGFSDPDIHEYDTLSSEERWNDSFDVILANPPFMSPKGGIRPHKKFSISSNRSEVLFVDYIAEHLNPKGRAGIIVPEGVIFQSGTAYKELRKMLVDNYLYAVVSLPAGIFNPYSGVKTSILLMDKELAKKTNEILFVKIDNDGFNLGAQRNAVKGGQLEEAIEIIHNFANNGKLQSILPSIAHTVPKSEITRNGEYNLSGERYKQATAINSDYEFATLSEVCEINPETLDPALLNIDEFIYLDISTVENGTGRIKFDNLIKKDEAPSRARRKIQDKDIILSTVRPNLKAFAYIENPPKNTIASTGFAVLRVKENLNSKFLFYNLFTYNMVAQMISMMGKGSYPSINQSDVASLKIPLPSLSIQEEIVAEIEGYQKIIDGAKMVVENYKPKIDIDTEWEMVELQSLCDVRDGTHNSPRYKDKGYPLITSKNIKDGKIDFENVNLISKEDLDDINKRSFVENGDIIMPMIGTIGNPIVVNKDREFAVKNVALIKFYTNSKINRIYLKNILDSEYFNQYYQSQSSGSTQKFISLGFIRSINIPLPALEIQEQISVRIEKEQNLVNANKQLIKIFEQKIKDRIAKVWGSVKVGEENISMAAEPEAEYL